MNLTNEPYVTGGNPVIAGSRQGAGAKVLFNDILGTSQGAANGEKYSAIKRDSFGEVLDNSVDGDYDYFTGNYFACKIERISIAYESEAVNRWWKV